MALKLLLTCARLALSCIAVGCMLLIASVITIVACGVWHLVNLPTKVEAWLKRG